MRNITMHLRDGGRIGLILILFALGCAKSSGGGGNNSCGSGQMPCNGTCVDVQSDGQNCGTCGLACDTGTVCQAGTCVCAVGYVSCSGQCVQSTPAHCGSSCAVCSDGQVCDNGQCSSSCSGGGVMCSDMSCSSNTDSGHCGSSCAVCPTGGACTNGTCGCTVAGQQNCSGTCLDTSSSTSNCGTCGHACGAGQTCDNGTCTGGSTTGTGGSGTGTGGSGTGGATTGTGGSGTGTGGAATGGTTGTGGAPGTGGAAPNQPVLVTSAANNYWKTSGTLTTVTSGTATVTVNDSSTMQTWQGFGGAFNELGWKYIQMLSTSDQQKAIDLLFGADAAHFAVGRIPIGASDYAIDRYTDDEVASGSTDYQMQSFKLATEETQYLIPYVQAAQKANPNAIFWASPWTPPTWMKTGPFTATNGSGTTTTSNFDSGHMMSSTQVLQAYALYLQAWVKAYQAQGIPIYAVAPQNEPSYAQNYPSCIWDTNSYTTLVGQYLGPAFKGMSTKILLGTMSASGDQSFVTSVMGDGTAKSVPSVMGFQWSMEGSVSGDKQYNLPIWQTEHRCGNYPGFTVSNPTPMEASNPNMPENDWDYGWESWELIRGWVNAGVSSYSAWNMVLDTGGLGIDTYRVWHQDALLTVDTSSKALTATPAYYVFRHCSQYVQVGATVVGTSGGEALAWKNPDGSEVAVMYNANSATTYIVKIAGKMVSFPMPSQGWATVYMPAQ